MPLEGHWERQNTPIRALGPAERRLALLAGGLLVAIVLATVLIIALDSGSKAPAQGCVDQIVASTTGGARYKACGEDAVRFCRAEQALSTAEAVRAQAQCRRAGIS